MKSTVKTRKAAKGVLDYIAAHPGMHNQDTWFTPPDEFYDIYEGGVEAKVQMLEANICKTTMCVAGTAVFLEHGVKALINPSRVLGDSYSGAGATLLGLNENQADWLFYDSTNEQAVEAVEAVMLGDKKAFKAIMKASKKPWA